MSLSKKMLTQFRLLGLLMLPVLMAACVLFMLSAPERAKAISISTPTNLTLTAIPGTGGASTGSLAWTVSTTLSGYNLTVSASAAPAMNSGSNSIADYPATTPEAWLVPATASAFGFCAEGPATPTATWGTPSTGAGKFRGFGGSTQINIASQVLLLSYNDTTTVYFKIEVGSSHFQPSGTYAATITATATSLP